MVNMGQSPIPHLLLSWGSAGRKRVRQSFTKCLRHHLLSIFHILFEYRIQWRKFLFLRGKPCFKLIKGHTGQIARGRFDFQMNFSSISADWHRRTEFRSTDSSLSAANMRWIIWKKEKRETTKPAGAPLVFVCKIIPVLYEVAC